MSSELQHANGAGSGTLAPPGGGSPDTSEPGRDRLRIVGTDAAVEKGGVVATFDAADDSIDGRRLRDGAATVLAAEAPEIGLVRNAAAASAAMRAEPGL